MKTTKVAIIGSGNIGTDLMIKILKESTVLELTDFVGIDPSSEGLAKASRLGVSTTYDGVKGLLKSPHWNDIKIIFDATSAKAHRHNYDVIRKHPGKRMIDLTPAAIGPYMVPAVEDNVHVTADNVNMVSCGGQATIPIVAAVSRVSRVHYAEIVASISSRSAGPGTRANIDEFTQTTATGLERVGGAGRGKAIIVLNPAEPPLIMRDTVFTLSEMADQSSIESSIQDMVAIVRNYVPGYELRHAVQFEEIPSSSPVFIQGLGHRHGLKTTVLLQVQGAGHYLPEYAGNLDIMTAAAVAAAEKLSQSEIETTA